MNLIFIQIQLDLLANFLDRVAAEAGQELSSIEERRMAGDFQSLGDYEHVVGRPLARIEIGARAVAYELVALVEGELHKLAHASWLASSTHKGPKNVQQLSRVNPETMTKLKMVSDLPFDEIVELIETCFGLSFRDIEGWNAIRGLRDAVNAFKHRRGLKHPREINWWSKDCAFPQQYKISQDEAVEAIKTVAGFFRGLKSVLEPASPAPPGASGCGRGEQATQHGGSSSNKPVQRTRKPRR